MSSYIFRMKALETTWLGLRKRIMVKRKVLSLGSGGTQTLVPGLKSYESIAQPSLISSWLDSLSRYTPLTHWSHQYHPLLGLHPYTMAEYESRYWTESMRIAHQEHVWTFIWSSSSHCDDKRSMDFQSTDSSKCFRAFVTFTHSHAELLQRLPCKVVTWSNLGFSISLKDTSTCRQGSRGIDPATFRLLDDPLYLLGHSQPT